MRRYLLQNLRRICGVSGSTYALSHGITLTDESGRPQTVQTAQSYLNIAPGVARFDYHVLARDPVGPNHFQVITAVLPDERVWSLFGLVDNHHGSYTSAWLANRLPSAITGAMADLFSRTKTSPDATTSTFRTIDDTMNPNSGEPFGDPTDEDIEDEMREAFLKLDDDIVDLGAVLVASNQRRRKRLETRASEHVPEALKPALSGSSVLYTFYDSQRHVLHVATTGNIRAIFGRSKGAQAGYDVELVGNGQISTDVRALEKAHPGEKGLVNESGDLFGVSPLRVFGMAPFKWSKEVKEKISFSEKQIQYEDFAAEKVLTPPYLSAEPFVTTIPIQEGDVLVFASSALFSSPSNPSTAAVFDMVDKSLNSSQRPHRQRIAEPRPAQGRVQEDMRALLGLTVNGSVGIFDSQENVWKNVFTSDDGWFEDRNVATRVVEGVFPNEKGRETIGEDQAIAVGVLVFGKQ